MSTNYLETIKMLIGVGLGWSVLPKTMIDDSVVVLDIDICIERTLGVIRHVNHTLSDKSSPFCVEVTDAGFAIESDVEGERVEVARLSSA